MKEFISISDKIEELTGKGREYLVDSFNNVIAIFLDGQLCCHEYILDVNRDENYFKGCIMNKSVQKNLELINRIVKYNYKMTNKTLADIMKMIVKDNKVDYNVLAKKFLKNYKENN